MWVHLREHGPPHVHVHLRGAVAKILLPVGGAPTRVVKTQGMTPRDANAALQLVHRHTTALMQAWSAIHGRSNAN